MISLSSGGTFGTISIGADGFPCKCPDITEYSLDPSYGFFPVTISYMVIPNE